MNRPNEEKLALMIEEARKKVNVRKENDLCRYIPGPRGGYVHHFTFRKMKTENTEELMQLLEQYILKPQAPKMLPHNPRAPRGSRKRLALMNLTKGDMDKLLLAVRASGDKEILRKLTPKRDLKAIKKELKQAINNDIVDFDLWNSYVEEVGSSVDASCIEAIESGASL